MDDVLRPHWNIPGVVAFTTLRHAGGSSRAPFDDFNLGARCGDTEVAVAENRAQLISKHALPSPPRWLRQVHGTRAIVDPGFEEPEADAAVTCAAGMTLAILTADCMPVVFAAADGSEIAAAHAGWRGMAGGILEATIAAMQTSPDRIIAWLGPAAGPQAYEVGQEVFDAFLACDVRDGDAFQPTRPGRWNADLYALARRRLASVGVTRVDGGGLCAISDPQRFFSHRRDQPTGRMATIVYRC
ncbi:MAG: peptidoglycan editing factor PgeF [Luteimonas sp.]